MLIRTDIGGQDRLRPLWRYYFEGTQALVYVVDSNDTRRIDESATELKMLLREDSLKDAKLLVLANKQVLLFVLFFWLFAFIINFS